MNKEAYSDYINKHIATVKQVWKDLQPFLTGSYWLEEHKFFTIDGLIEEHDKSKFAIEEFNGYCQWFYPTEKHKKNKDVFIYAVQHHFNHNPHHWNYWVTYKDGKAEALDMPFIYILEMLCDWTAMSYQLGGTPELFFYKNINKMLLHENTKQAIKNWLPLFVKLAENYAKRNPEGVK